MSGKTVSLVILSVLIIIVSADVMCYWGTSYTTGNHEVRQTSPTQCPGQYCMKQYQKNYNYKNYQSNSYGCANGGCSRTGCNEDGNGFGTCCCRGNYCNSGYDLSKTAVSSMVLTVASVMYMYF